MEKVSRRKTAEGKAALMEIERTRRNGFNPGDELINEAIQTCGPVLTLAALRLAARADRKIFAEVH